MMVVVTGASGSGKSEYAEGVAVKLAGKVVTVTFDIRNIPNAACYR